MNMLFCNDATRLCYTNYTEKGMYFGCAYFFFTKCDNIGSLSPREVGGVYYRSTEI